MASSGASPHLLKKALGQISLNSPRLNHRIVPRKKKPLFSPAAAATAATAAAKEARAHDTEHVAATEASSAPSPAPGVEASQLVSPRRSGVAMKDKDSASNERTSAKATSMDGEVRSPSAAEVRGRPSMMAVTANPRLQEVSALPSGTVVRVKLFSEDAGEERLQETLKEKPAAAVADATIDKEVGASVAAMAPALAADVAGLSVCTKVAEQQHQQEKGDGGDVDEALAKDLSRAIQSSLQLQDNTPLADYQHDQTVLGAVENDMVEEASTSTVAVPPMGSTIGNDQGHEMVASTQGHEKNEKARVAAEDQDRQQRKIESAMTETGAGVVTVAENENVTIVEKEQEHNLEGDASATLPQAEKEGDVVLISPTQGKCDVISMSPSPLNKEDGIVRISPPEEAAVVTNGPAEVIVEGGAGAGAPGVRRAAAANERDEGSLVNSDMAQHSGLVVDAETETLVEKSKYLHFEEDERIVRCTLTGKKLAPDYVGILNYITSRKVQQLMVEGQFFMSVSPADL